jgi:hypothetical protein
VDEAEMISLCEQAKNLAEKIFWCEKLAVIVLIGRWARE